jgi:hypothetical protein
MQESTQVVNGAKAELLDNGSEPALKKVVLVVFKHNANTRIDMLLKKAIVLRENIRD